MPTPRLRSLSVKGFRAYGATEQTLNLPSDIAAVWGPNSKGKTSLAEAFEFLLTGQITRRQLLASSQDEFADALRNAHLGSGEEVYVAARVVDKSGKTREVKRVLTADYGKRQDCNSRLEIDGKPATQADLLGLGITLSQPPLEAPVLAQHTLGYIFSVGPQNRATYFKTLLEVTDLEQFRNDVASLASEVVGPIDGAIAKFDGCMNVTALKGVLEGVTFMVPDAATLNAKLAEAGAALIATTGEEAPATLDERLAVIERVLSERRSKAFPIRGLDRSELAGWSPPTETVWSGLTSYIEERRKVTEEMRRIVALFDQALKLPPISGITAPIDCPLCGTESALTPERVSLIRQHVEHTVGLKAAEVAAKQTLSELSASAASLTTASTSALPQWLKSTAAKRRPAAFTIARITEVLGDHAQDLITPWLAKVRPLTRAAAALRRAAQTTRALTDNQAGQLETVVGFEEVREAFADLSTRRAALASAIDAYKPPAEALIHALNKGLDARADTTGWKEFLDIARQPATLRTALIESEAQAVVRRELETALTQIDRAQEDVLNDKFADYSAAIQAWWERMRPDEPTFFSAIQPRKGARRTIDFKAGLSPDTSRTAPKLRDVIAVFSQSQLHCLGLALFLARAEREGTGFIVLDDPVLSSDEDYKVHFNATVLAELLKVPMQVIVLTQDHATWEELETRYRHLGISNALIYLDSPAAGSIIENTSDVLLAKINRAKSLARGGHPDVRKECGIQLRDAGERYCKEMLVNDRRANGDTSASLSDYDGKNLDWLTPRVEPLLDRDASHPGKLTAFKKAVNDACHDNVPPGTAAMTQACGEIGYFVKEYLGR